MIRMAELTVSQTRTVSSVPSRAFKGLSCGQAGEFDRWIVSLFSLVPKMNPCRLPALWHLTIYNTIIHAFSELSYGAPVGRSSSVVRLVLHGLDVSKREHTDRDAVVEVLIAEHESWPCISLKEGEESGETEETPPSIEVAIAFLS
jgi:hypothetical protein